MVKGYGVPIVKVNTVIFRYEISRSIHGSIVMKHTLVLLTGRRMDGWIWQMLYAPTPSPSTSVIT